MNKQKKMGETIEHRSMARIKNDKPAKSTRSTKLTITLMRLIGMWRVSNIGCRMKLVMSSASLYAMWLSMIISASIQTQALYYSKDIMTLIYVAPCASIVCSEIAKLLVFTLNRRRILALNDEIDRAIFDALGDDPEEIGIFNGCERLCFKAITIYACLLQCICLHYLLPPAIESLYLQDTIDRTFPFPLFFALPVITRTPNYEIIYFLETIGTMAVSMCATIFASYLFAVNMFTAAQFRILNLRLRRLCDRSNGADTANKRYDEQTRMHAKLKDCIRLHQRLIDYADRVENLYCFVMLGQIFGSVTQICFSGLQIMLSDSSYTSAQRKILSAEFLLGSFCQLYFYCYSSHEIYAESELVAKSMYSCDWYRLTEPKLRKDFSLLARIVVHRARRPCTMTVGKFCPLNLKAFSSVLSTSMSYYTVLRKTTN